MEFDGCRLAASWFSSVDIWLSLGSGDSGSLGDPNSRLDLDEGRPFGSGVQKGRTRGPACQRGVCVGREGCPSIFKTPKNDKVSKCLMNKVASANAENGYGFFFFKSTNQQRSKEHVCSLRRSEREREGNMNREIERDSARK